MMVKSKVYKGIEYVQLSELPKEQQELLANSLNKSLTIKILVNGTIVSDCLQFREYVLWYESIFKPQTKHIVTVPAKHMLKSKVSQSYALEEN